jgi:hypothetical protein
VRERIEYRFRVSSATVFTLYSYSKVLEYRFRVSTAGSLRTNDTSCRFHCNAHACLLVYIIIDIDNLEVNLMVDMGHLDATFR